MNIIELNHITKSFDGHIAVDDLSLEVPKGSIYGFIGPNGSGKTTTIRMIMNILYPDNGEIKIFGKKHNKKVEALSKGMSQKVQFIITIINRPEIIILDEPFSGLDPVNAEIIKEVILDLRDKGATILFSTHDMSVAERMCDFIFMIYKGKKVLDGTLGSIQNKYGQDTIRVHSEGGAHILEGIPGIEKINDFGQIQELRMNDGADSQKILSTIMSRTKVSKFEIASPSLNDIFIRIARPEKTEANE
jgi:ABC-2 type transport system ATP-binding protein